MKKIVASVLYVTYLAFGVSAHAAEQDSAPSSDAVVSQKEVKKAERKTERKTERAADRALSRKIVWALSKTKGLNAVNVRVLVRHGVVTLTGYVPDSEQVQLAGDSASRVAGVTSVVNNLVPGEPGR
ncbi:TPA: BON domain-containing protein [Burkholderia vietnamiensis]|uniref:BON domain-containing protein n=1 Tax=Burkholderia vietnamiensis TaxID=60552 RepID=UPI001B968A3F|nr:BON domain-containing protein [Burkholderia vietnamiensis]MBR7910793.1 BON domain-containing protein [Burkholderia vietnamiensis]MBR8081296.1 BON domain-containing protein [Burkholderia vietnamiensis]HDR9277405.1 BON domain-containing protein [Burkholderia vietnamiensis]